MLDIEIEAHHPSFSFTMVVTGGTTLSAIKKEFNDDVPLQREITHVYQKKKSALVADFFFHLIIKTFTTFFHNF